MNKYDEFRANASECQRMADGTKNSGDKKRWLQMAESWLRMIKKRETPAPRETPTERFDAAERVDGTHQTKSDSSH